MNGGSDYIMPLEGKDYTWYISGIFPVSRVIIYAYILSP